MRKPQSVKALDDLGRVRLSPSFFLRDFLHSEVASFHGMPNIPDDPDLAITAGRRLCEDLLEPLQAAFGRITIRSAYRAASVNAFCNAQQRAGKTGYPCASNTNSAANHIWDLRDAAGNMGATACIVIPWLADRYAAGADWRGMAWWVHDHLPYHRQFYFPRLAAFNLTWRENPERRIDSYIAPRGCLTKPGMANHTGAHDSWYQGFPAAP
ncbi:MAG: hypothetical protein ACNA7O_07875 [Rhodobacterales bacterium]